MINIQPYIDRLEALKIYTQMCIDEWIYTPFVIDTDLTIHSNFTPEEIIKAYQQTGILFYKKDPDCAVLVRDIPFDTWYAENQQELKQFIEHQQSTDNKKQ